MRTIKERLKSIYWKKDALLVNLTQEEFSNVYNYCLENGVIPKSNNDTKEWISNKLSYKLDTQNKYTYLFTFTRRNLKIYNNALVVFTTNNFDDNKNRHSTESIGLDSAILAEKKFKELYAGVSLRQAFGYAPSSIKHCIPKQFYFTNPKRLGYNEHASSIDICSHYPSCLCGPLPDWRTAKEIPGTVEPNEEYPFAFYIKSGHSAEYKRYDTHNWLNTVFEPVMFEKTQNCFLEPEKDTTILCKYSHYELTEVINYYYSLKLLGNADAKTVMNSFIGYCHTKTYRTFRLAHIAVIALGRANDKLLQIAKGIGYHNIIQLCVDGIIYRGSGELGNDSKALGSIRQEFTDCNIFIRSINNYIVKKNDKFIKAKHSGCNAWDDDTRLEDEDELLSKIKSIDDCMKWKKKDYMENIR